VNTFDHWVGVWPRLLSSKLSSGEFGETDIVILVPGKASLGCSSKTMLVHSSSHYLLCKKSTPALLHEHSANAWHALVHYILKRPRVETDQENISCPWRRPNNGKGLWLRNAVLCTWLQPKHHGQWTVTKWDKL